MIKKNKVLVKLLTLSNILPVPLITLKERVLFNFFYPIPPKSHLPKHSN